MKIIRQPLPSIGMFTRTLLLFCSIAALFSTNVFAQTALKDLAERCSNERSRVTKPDYDVCSKMGVKASGYRTCLSAADAKGTTTYNTCMASGDARRGACAAKELITTRSGLQGLNDRYCGLSACGYSYAEIVELLNFKGGVGGGAAGIAAPPGWTPTNCPGQAKAATTAPVAAPVKAGPDMGTCKSAANFKNSGWKCSDLVGQAKQFTQYDIPATEHVCTSSQAEALANAKDDGVCTNVIEQREAVIKKYRDADAKIEMGKCKPVSGVSNTGWTCDAVKGQFGEYEKHTIPAAEQICTQAQATTMIKRKDVGNCSNIVNQVSALVAGYVKKAADAKAAADLAALKKVDMGSCKPVSGFPNTGWACNGVPGQEAELDELKVPAAQRICTPEQAKTLAALADAGNCSNVIAQRDAVVRKFRAAANEVKAKAEAAARAPKIDMGSCKSSASFQSKGWSCEALKGQAPQFDAFNIPAAGRICSDAQADALVTAKDDAVCSNVIEQRNAVIKGYADKAKAVKEAFMGKCKAAAGFENTGFACSAVDAFLTEAAKYQVPAANLVCSAEQAKELIAAKNDGVCSNVARQIAAATQKHRADLASGAAQKAAADKAAADKAAADKAAADKLAADKLKAAGTDKAAADKAAADKAAADKLAADKLKGASADMGTCKAKAGIDGKGWDCRQVAGGLEEAKKMGVPHPCTDAQAAALIKAANVAECGNVVVQVGQALDAKYKQYQKAKYLDLADAALAAAKGTKLLDKGVNGTFLTRWDKEYLECKNTLRNESREKQWCDPMLKDAAAMKAAVDACKKSDAGCKLP